jgi:hypothetical protein
MDKAARRLNQAFEVIRILRSRPHPEMLEHIVGFVITLLIPAAEKSQVTRMLRDVVASLPRGCTHQLFDELGNSLVFVHGELRFAAAEMTGNRAGGIFRLRGWCAHTAAARG